MAELRVVLADDEPLGRLALRQLLARHADLRIVGEACDGRQAVALVRQAAPDLLLLDIQMPELDGFAVIAEIGAERRAPPPTIFVTAHDSFAVRAFEAHALDYLMKPVAEARFDAALARVRRAIADHQAGELARRMADLITGVGARQAAPRERLVARLGDRSTVIAVADIDWIEAQDYCAAVHAGGAIHVVRQSLSALETELDPARFVRIHRGALVNVARIRELHHGGGELTAVLHTGDRLPVSRRRRDALEKLLGAAG
ncbi:MAG TPA: LytTR family DNA-binding domain-containing protein [Kofleriaceae bacterium]|nr:LytTR family DNA-binding domain-containing protein [Kofleriaceae bacterium]